MSFSFAIRFKLLNVVILVRKQVNIWHFDQILELSLHLGQKCVTMETRNLQCGIIRTFPPSIG